ncbi:MAG TPA: hypothetical protein PKA37_16420, partial [Planctomycetota bacterium]|nr:hypothetical protein [Planctomycetota bacterium]
GNLQILNKSYMGDGSRVGPIRRDIAKFRERLGEFPKEDAQVQAVAKVLDNHEGLFQKWMTEYEADVAGAVGIPERLEALKQKYEGDHRPILPAEPFDPAFIETWSSDVGQWLHREIPTDLAFLESLSGNAALGRSGAAGLKHYIGMSWRDRLMEMSNQLTQMINSQLTDSIKFAEFLRATDPKDQDQVTNRILGEGALDRATERLETGRAALAMARSLDKNLKLTPKANRDEQGKALDAGMVHLKELSVAALDQVRMPKAKSEDAEMRAAAFAVLKASDIPESAILRLVVTTDKVRREKREGSITPGTVQARVEMYHYVWEEFQVATAEKVGNEVWIHYTTLKKYEGGGSKTPLNRWVMAGRFKSTPIKPEHVQK